MASTPRVDQLTYLLILTLLVHSRVSCQKNIALCLDLRPQLSVQHLIIGVVHGHICSAKDPLASCAVSGDVPGAEK